MWRSFANFAKQRPWMLKVADRLGRGYGRLRPLDHAFGRPPKSPLIPNLSDWENRVLSAVWIGHATILLRIGGMTILTDPVFSDRVGLGIGLATLGPRRFVQPAISIRQLPPIDLVLVSHAHFDHLDRPSLLRLRRSVPVVTSSENCDLIRDLGFRKVRALQLNERLKVRSLTITSLPVKHWGPRVFLDKHRGYAAFLIDSADHRVLFGADSAFGEHFDQLANRPPDLAILGISAYDPYVAAHATPEQAWTMFERMKARHLLPMHHSTFRLSREPMDEPMRRLMKVAGPDKAKIVVSEIGGEWTLGK